MPSFLDYALPGASMASGIANSLINYQSQRETRDMQIDLMREQNKFQEKMYERQLHDNSPMEQVRKLGAAGLNPSLAFSDAQGISTSSVGSPPSLSAPQVNFSDVALNAAQSLNLLSDSNKSAEETKGLSIDNMYRDAKNLVTLDKLDSERGLNDVQKAYYRALETITQRSAQSQVEGFDLANQKTRLEFELLKAETEKFASEKAVNDSVASLNWKEDDYRVPLLRNTIRSLIAKANLDYANVGYVGQLKWNTYEDTLKIQAERHGIKLDNAQVKAMWPSVRESLRLSVESLRKTLRQQGSDYWNPFRYAGMFFGGTAAGITSNYMKNAGVGAGKRVVVRGFVP